MVVASFNEHPVRVHSLRQRHPREVTAPRGHERTPDRRVAQVRLNGGRHDVRTVLQLTLGDLQLLILQLVVLIMRGEDTVTGKLVDQGGMS